MSSLVLVWAVLGTSAGCSRLEPAGATPPPPAGIQSKPVSEAERITQTERMLDDAKADLAATEAELTDPMSDYARTEAEFKELDAAIQAEKKAVAKLRAAGDMVATAKAEAALTAHQAEWEQTRDRFNLLIMQRKTLQEKQTALAMQIENYRQKLDELKGVAKAPPVENKVPVQPPAAAAENPPAAAVKEPPPAAAALPPGIPGVPVVPGAAPPAAKEPAPKTVKDDAEIRAARAAAEDRKAALAAVEEQAKSVDARVRVLEALIATEERLLEAERKVADQAERDLARLTQQLTAATAADRQGLLAKTEDTQTRLGSTRDRIAKLTDRIAALNDDRNTVQADRIAALQLIDEKRKEADGADAELKSLQNPLSTRNVNKWLATHGINMLLIAAGILSLHVMVRQSSRRIVQFVSRNSNRGTEEDRENRASTLVGVFRYATTLIIFGGGIVMLLDEAGVPVVPLMGGAAVMGLAVAFGAQNLIKDYFTGFMMLLEDQYGVNDVVRIGAISGLVEKITLRVTVLRDLEGVLHFIPHGQMTAVSNMTHGWSRALFDIPVPHTADLTRTMDELVRLAKDMRGDPAFAHKIIEDPDMLGVDALDGTASTVRFMLKTRPLQQWSVKRELLRRIKLRFAELGIELAPNQVLQLRLPDAPAHDRHDRHDGHRGSPQPHWAKAS